MSNRIDVVVNENGASTCVRALEQLADSSQKLSPSLAKSLRGQALRLGVNLERVVKDAAIAILDTVVHTTPHDTGRARRNWSASIRTSRPTNATTEDTDYDGDLTVAEGTAIIKASPRAPGQGIFISNALEYIVPLNEGHSQQAAAGFVERGVQSGVDSVKQARGTLFKDGE